MGDIQKQIQTLEKKSSSKEEVEKLNQNVAAQTTQLLKSNADTAIRLCELTTKMEQLEAKLEDTNRRLSQLSQQIAETQSELLRLRNAGANRRPLGPRRAAAPRLPGGTGPARSGGPVPGRALRHLLRRLLEGPLRPGDPGVPGLPGELPVDRPLRQRPVLDRRVPLRPAQVPGGDRGLHGAPQAVALERQGRRGSPEEGLRPARARPEAGGRRPAPVRHPRVSDLRGGAAGQGQAQVDRGGREVAAGGRPSRIAIVSPLPKSSTDRSEEKRHGQHQVR